MAFGRGAGRIPVPPTDVEQAGPASPHRPSLHTFALTRSPRLASLAFGSLRSGELGRARPAGRARRPRAEKLSRVSRWERPSGAGCGRPGTWRTLRLAALAGRPGTWRTLRLAALASRPGTWRTAGDGHSPPKAPDGCR